MHTYSQLIFFDKGAKAIQWEKENFSTDETICFGTIRRMGEKNETLTPTSHHNKINLR